MAQFHSPKLLIVDYYDSLINRIDIYTEELLEKYSEDDVLPEESEPSEHPWWSGYKEVIDNPYKIDYNGILNTENQVNDVIPGSTKVHDYLNRVRSKAIEEIGKVRDENLSRYELNKEKFKYSSRDELTEEKIEEMRSELFKESFCFLLSIDRLKNNVNFSQYSNCLFKLHTVVTDCYFDSNDQEIISSDIYWEKPLVYLDDIFRSMLSKYISDLLCCILPNSYHKRKYGNEVITFTKEHFYKIEHISIGPQTTPRLGYEEFDFDLPSQSGFTLTHLKSIEIIREVLNAKCEIKNIERLENLEYISIENLKISEKLKDELAGLSKLVALTLNKSGVTKKLSGGVFRPPSNLSVLQVINLNYPIDFESAPKLETLYLNGVSDYNHLLNLKSSIDLHIWKHDSEVKKRENFLKDHNFSKVTLY